MMVPLVTPLGDGALTLTFGNGISEELSEAVVMRARAIGDAAIVGVTDVVPSYATVTIFYDAATIGYDDIRRRVLDVVGDGGDFEPSSAQVERRIHRIAVVYDGEDLAEVAKRTGLSTAGVISLHSEMEYRVFVTGFVPGFAYLGVLDERLSLPRREAPRKRVPAGSVAIAERQTGVYPASTPGGWHLIGTTTERMFDPRRSRPALLCVGDLVRFDPL